jgi:hypothetical protein
LRLILIGGFAFFNVNTGVKKIIEWKHSSNAGEKDSL